MSHTVCENNQCCGCMACVDICPKHAIHIKDSLDAYNAVINSSFCINCNACYNVCQVNRSPEFYAPIYWKQGWTANEAERASSSSGGVAAAIEKAFIKRGGVVISCCFENGTFIFKPTSAECEIEKYKGSKYVKSDPSGIYKEIKSLLRSGRDVFFLGLPCQAAAVRNFAGNTDHLIIAELICHGTPSPRILSMYLQTVHMDITKIKDIRFRVKDSFGIREGERRIGPAGIQDYYTKVFLESVCYTENCYTCKYAQRRRCADITLGDSWGSELPEQEQKKGISLILCQTEKGKKLVEEAGLHLIDVDLERAIKANHQLEHPANKNEARDVFFNGIKKGRRFNKVMFQCFPKRFIKNSLKSLLIRLHIIRV